MESVKDAISKMTMSKKLVTDWKKMLPPGSRWNPGNPGNPSCKICNGTGYVRLDLPVGHPNFGKIFLCECVDLEKYR